MWFHDAEPAWTLHSRAGSTYCDASPSSAEPGSDFCPVLRAMVIQCHHHVLMMADPTAFAVRSTWSRLWTGSRSSSWRRSSRRTASSARSRPLTRSARRRCVLVLDTPSHAQRHRCFLWPAQLPDDASSVEQRWRAYESISFVSPGDCESYMQSVVASGAQA